MIDEPMVGLDPIHARVVKDELRAQADKGTTILMSTHLLNMAEELSDRLGIISQGELVALGAPAEILKEAGGKDLEQVFLEKVGALDDDGTLKEAATAS